MNQAAFQEITKMLNGFPRTAGNTTALMLTFEEDLTGVSDQAIIETARRYRRNEVPDQSKDFAPSIASFVHAARRQQEIIAYRSRPRIARPVLPTPAPQQTPEQRARIAEGLRQLAKRLAAKAEEDRTLLAPPAREPWFVERSRDPFAAKGER